MESNLLSALVVMGVFAAVGMSIRHAIELKRWRTEAQKLERRLTEIEAETSRVEQTLRFERASAKSYAVAVQEYVHKCRHDLASSVNVASGFLELMNQVEYTPSLPNGRTDQIKRALAALNVAKETMTRMPSGLPSLRLTGELADEANRGHHVFRSSGRSERNG